MEKFASLLSADACNYQKITENLEKDGFSGIHFDVMDGHFVKNFAFSPHMIESLRKITNLKFNIHLQIENPEVYINEFIDVGADMLTIHPETCDKVERELRFIKARQVKTSIAFEPYAEIKDIEKYFPLLDNIIVLTVYPGFGKQKFMDQSFKRIRDLKDIIVEKKYPISISVDGSVNAENSSELIKCGADILIYGSSIFS